MPILISRWTAVSPASGWSAGSPKTVTMRLRHGPFLEGWTSWGVGDFGGGELTPLRQRLGAQRPGPPPLGVPTRPEPPSALRGGAGAECGRCRGDVYCTVLPIPCRRAVADRRDALHVACSALGAAVPPVSRTR